MLPLLLFGAGLCLFLLPALSGPAARRLPAAEWSRLCGVLLCAGAGTVELGIILAGLPTWLRTAGVPGLADACERAMDGFFPAGGVLGWIAAFFAVGLPALAAMGARKASLEARSFLALPATGRQVSVGRYDLVVLPISAAIAVSVSGSTGRIFISDGLTQALSREQLGLVIRHEAAHLDLSHQRWLRVASALEHSVGVFRPLRRSTMAWRRALERCADEAAAGPDITRRRLLRSALLDLTIGTAGSAVAAFGAVETILERVDALLEEPPVPRLSLRVLVYGPAVWAAGIAAMGTLSWVMQQGSLLALAGHCGP